MSLDIERELDWEVVKCLMEARSHTDATMEQYLLYLTHDDVEMDQDGLERCLDEAIDRHERAIEDLEMARRQIGNANRQ